MEMLEKVALALAFGGEEFKCPFEHDPDEKYTKENKIPPQHANKSGILGTAIKEERIKERTADSAYLAQRKEEKGGGEVKVTKYGYSPHHIIPGNEIWNKEGGDSHPIRAWIDKETTGSKVNGDIGYVNNSYYNGIDLPSHHKFSRIADWSASEEMQYDYAKGAMDAAAEDGAESRQFHDSHKAYSDMVWKALEKINARLNAMAKEGKCPEGKKNCPLENPKDGKFDPPYNVLDRLISVAERLQARLCGEPNSWKNPVVTSRFALMYSKGMGYQDQKQAGQEISKARDKMGRPTD